MPLKVVVASLATSPTNSSLGPEKLLEVWFSSSPTTLPAGCDPVGLKVVPAETWKSMLDLVNCRILSIIESDKVDAYLLSESSMFVFPHKIILKTCGTTTLLRGLPSILEIAALAAGFPHDVADGQGFSATAAYPYRVFYSRKNFLFPDRQLGPHRSWRDEVKSLDKQFSGGSAYAIGKLNGEHWYLYLTEPNTLLTPPSTPEGADVSQSDPQRSGSRLSVGSNSESDDDETLEILMTDLDPENAQQFYLDHAQDIAEGKHYERASQARLEAQQSLGSMADLPSQSTNLAKPKPAIHVEDVDIFSSNSDPSDVISDNEPEAYPEELTTEGHALGTVISESCGLSDVYPVSNYPDAKIDAYLFTPCGFSANGVIPTPNGPEATHYFTVHVTPEPHCSYASFETNVPHKQTGRQTADIINQVVKIFKPGRFTVTLFEGKKSGDDEGMINGSSKKDTRWERFEGYKRTDRIVHDLDGYDLVFKHFDKVDPEGNKMSDSWPRIGERDF